MGIYLLRGLATKAAQIIDSLKKPELKQNKNA